jgi:branched-chain amino acid aminotransferase
VRVARFSKKRICLPARIAEHQEPDAMTFPKSQKIWMNGTLVPWDDARVHVGSHALHYGSSVFEGIRCYATPKGSAVFRLGAHLRRMFDSAKIYRIEMPYSIDEMSTAVLETIRANELSACYVRPLAFRGYGSLGVNPLPCPVDVVVMVWEWGKYLGTEALENGVDVRVSSWSRMAPNTLPAMAKVGANYMNSQLIKLEALQDGYAEGIALGADGHVSEGSGENIFVVHRGVMMTPPLASSVLPGITRDSVLTLARVQGLTVVEQPLPREILYLADEVFFTGTAAEITPIRSIDRVPVGTGRRGPVTEALQKAFFDVIECRAPDEHSWLSFVPGAGAAS